MSKKYVVALTVGLAIPAFALSRVIWPDPPGAPVPPSGLLPFLMVPAVFEALASAPVSRSWLQPAAGYSATPRREVWRSPPMQAPAGHWSAGGLIPTCTASIPASRGWS